MKRKKAEKALKDEKQMISLCRSTLESLKRMRDESMIYELINENSSENNEEIFRNESKIFIMFVNPLLKSFSFFRYPN